MNWEAIKNQLEAILNAPVRFEKISVVANGGDTPKEQSGQRKPLPLRTTSIEKTGTVYFHLYKEDDAITALAVEAVFLTTAERRLIELMIDAHRTQDHKPTAATRSEDEGRALAVRSWINRQLESGDVNQEMPEMFAPLSSLYTAKIPLLLYGGYSDQSKVSYQSLKKLLESFFDDEVLLIPLMEKEWLILGSEALLKAGEEDRESEQEESLEDTLASIGYGLYEMMTSEWIGECHLSVQYPIVPAKSLLPTIIQMRDAISLGRAFHIGTNIHLPWRLHLDRLLYMVPDGGKQEFVENVLKRIDYLLDAEMLQTLEHFFELDCNVSETAKKMYIHRNTLLYRLDKFKQETGLDVRTFRDAVLVYIALQLYKVTKRK